MEVTESGIVTEVRLEQRLNASYGIAPTMSTVYAPTGHVIVAMDFAPLTGNEVRDADITAYENG